MLVLGFFVAALIGVSLGLIGGGGSILTVPVLVYLVGIPPWMATTYSLFIVGVSSLAGALRSHPFIDKRTVVLFGSSSIASVLITRRILVPLIPGYLFRIGSLAITRDVLLMTLFGLLMIAASFSMLRAGKTEETETPHKRNYWFLLLQGLMVGTVTGLLGAGGGFLIIPALVLFSDLPMKNAVATSLSIIAVNSLIGFFGSTHFTLINWEFLLTFTLLAVAGIFLGTALSKRIAGGALKKGFGWFVLGMGIFVLVREFLFP